MTPLDGLSFQLYSARTLEPLAYLNIQLGYVLGMGPNIGFKLLHG